MLFESKADGSLAAHATQTNLRLVEDESEQGMTVLPLPLTRSPNPNPNLHPQTHLTTNPPPCYRMV